MTHLLSASSRGKAFDLPSWLENQTGNVGSNDDPFDTAVFAAFEMDRLAGVVAAGYAGALARLSPTSKRLRRSLAVTESGGNTPRAIQTRWNPDTRRLNGTKSFVTLGAEADRVMVLAARGKDSNGRKDLIVLEVPTDAPGVVVTPLPTMSVVPELPHARIDFTEVAVDAVAIEDAWTAAIKPFRFLEDVFILGCTAAWFLRLGRESNQTATTCRLAALLPAARALSAEIPLSHTTAIAHAGLHNLVHEVIREFDWSGVDEVVRSRWERDRKVLLVGARAREARTAQALEHFDA